ncbi:MAG: carboxymethylenebutenolidase [Betaproteobacteria bacterium]|nr:carboxymethylenebutenolidase [Betaproteobacteria bacterium]
MGTTITLTAADGHKFSCYKAEPSGKPKGAIVVIQEIFGVNDHIRKTADLYASEGYLALAPAVFDRVKPGVDIGYTMPEMQQGVGLKAATKIDDALQDIQATVDEAGKAGKVGIVGYCFGGLLAWYSSARVKGLAAAVPYYGGGIPDVVNEQPKVPVMMHFGEKDSYIPMEGVEKVKAKHPTAQVFVYPADHGFNCDQRGAYEANSAKEARQRTLDFFKQHVAEQ